MTKKIIFKALNKEQSIIQDRPYPASQSIPDWFREMTPYEISNNNPDGKRLIIENGISNATFKKCTPLLDGMTSGYIVPLWADVLVEQQTIPYITWRTKTNIFQLHGTASRMMPAPPGYDQVVFKYLNTWIPITPPGYSMLVISPLGYRGLPFHAIPAVVDTDKSTLELIFPMWIKTGLTGVVEAGTPMVQLIPFKRDEWKAEFDYYEDGEHEVINETNFNKTLVNHYIKKHWSKKTYK